MKLSKAILRIFEVRAIPGNAQLLKQKLSDTSVSVVKGKPGNLGYFFGANLTSDENDLVFISVWEDLESIKSLFGKDWEESFLPEGYDEIIESCSIKHIEVDGNLVPSAPADLD
ncbi:MAG: antibiotic biosynthesis monooxygenase [Cyanobacteria bacterium P01_F01_bin.3]